MHAEGWANHLEETKSEHLPEALRDGGAAPLHAAKAPPVGAARLRPTGAGAKVSATTPLHAETPRVEPVHARPQPSTASVQRDRQMSWMIPAGAGAALIAAVAIWAMNRPSEAPVTPPAIVTGSAEPQTEVAAATPVPETPAASQAEDSTTTTVAAAPAPAEPAATTTRLGPPVTTTRPAADAPAVVAQAPAPAARPDMVLRAAPNSPAATLSPPTTVAAAPTNSQPLSVPPGSAPIVMPPTAAGPATAMTPQTTPQAMPPATPPLASTTPAAPDTVTGSTAPGTPAQTQAQAQPQPPQQLLPTVEDSGITAKVRMALSADSTLAAVPIAVSTDHGVVKLEGQAPDTQTRERATVVASSTGGVKAVDNRLTVPPAAVVSQAPTSQQ
ncbi:hypothetical protein ASC95_06380 [Pelomonas sp. Root1217]|nr:hypothetical protein ASC95_06380 [Pelomonas sp. Root1217]